MPTRSPSCRRSSPCRLEWRPSRWQAAAHVLFAVLMPWAVLATHLTGPARWPMALLAAGVAAGQGIRYVRRPRCHLLIPADDAPAEVDGQLVERLALHDRGPLLQLTWRSNGRRQARLFWPDTLSPTARRELRLAMQARCISRSRPAMAP
jgi:toxin CptA